MAGGNFTATLADIGKEATPPSHGTPTIPATVALGYLLLRSKVKYNIIGFYLSARLCETPLTEIFTEKCNYSTMHGHLKTFPNQCQE